MAIFLLGEDIVFPNPELAEEDGLLAIGGDLSIDRLILAYSYGIFPWYNPGEEILWWCPKNRFIIDPIEIHISNSMKRLIKKNRYKITYNNDFYGVISNCKDIREKEGGTWITDEMRSAYYKLHELRYAESVEVYDEEELVGGIYGVKIGKCFFGESMFSKVPNASKLALIYLCKKLYKEQYYFLDCQFYTEHLERMGGREMVWNEFNSILEENRKNINYN